MSDTIAAVSTGTQVCAIGIVRMSGSKAIDIADRLFSVSYTHLTLPTIA